MAFSEMAFRSRAVGLFRVFDPSVADRHLLFQLPAELMK